MTKSNIDSDEFKDAPLNSRLSLLEMRVAQYRQRIEMLETGMNATTERLKATEKLNEILEIRIAAAEHHCSWTTDQIQELQSGERAAPQPSVVDQKRGSVLYPIVRAGLRVLSAAFSVAPDMREALAFRLYSRKRHIYRKLKELSPAVFEPIEKTTSIQAWQTILEEDALKLQKGQVAVSPLSLVPNSLSAVMSNPVLASLPRPDESILASCRTATDKQDEQLKSVTRLAQVRQGATSVSFVVFIQEHDRVSIDRTLQSVFRQTDPSWELLLCAGNDPDEVVDSWLDRDWRIRRIPQQPSEIAAMVRSAAFSTSTFVGLLSPGDVVDDDLVSKIGQVVGNRKDLVAVYTDEATRSPNGDVINEFFKPGWSPDHQLSVNMLGRFLAIQKQFLLNFPVDTWCESIAAEYLLTLRLTGKSLSIAHLDQVMYLRAEHKGERSVQPGGSFSAQDIGVAKIETQHYLCETSDPKIVVEADDDTKALRVRWPTPPELPVTLVILTNMRSRNVEHRGEILMVHNFVKSIIEKSTYQGYKIIVVDDGYVPAALTDLLHLHGHSSQTYRSQGAFSFAAKANFATSLAPSGVVILLNDDLEVIAND